MFLTMDKQHLALLLKTKTGASCTRVLPRKKNKLTPYTASSDCKKKNGGGGFVSDDRHPIP